VRQIILADRHHVRLAEQDVARLVNRVGEQQSGERMAGGFHLRFHRRVAVQLGFGDQREEWQHELILGGHCGMREDHRLLGVDAGGHVVQHEIEHVVVDVLGGIAVGDHLVVGDDDIRVHAEILHGDTLADGAEEVAEMQTAGGAVSGEHGEFARVRLELGERFVGTLLRREEARAHFIARRGELRVHVVGHAGSLFSSVCVRLHALYGLCNKESS